MRRLKKIRQVLLDFLLSVHYNGRLRDPDSKMTKFARQVSWVPTLDREKWDKYRKGESDEPVY